MDVDLENSLKLFGDKYNDIQSTTTVSSRNYNGLLNELPTEFDKADLMAAALKKRIRTRVKQILYKWKNAKLIKCSEIKGKYIKI